MFSRMSNLIIVIVVMLAFLFAGCAGSGGNLGDQSDVPDYPVKLENLKPVSVEIDLEVTVVGWGDQPNKPWEIILKNVGNHSLPPSNGMFDYSNIAIVQFKYQVRGGELDDIKKDPRCFIAKLLMIVPAAGKEIRIQLPVQQLYPPWLDWPWWVEGWKCSVGSVLAVANYEFVTWQFAESDYDNNIAMYQWPPYGMPENCHKKPHFD